MSKYVHIWEIECSSCRNNFLHEFKAVDILRPHMFADLYFTCPECGKKGFDHVHPMGKISLDEWEQKHPDMSTSDLPEYNGEER